MLEFTVEKISKLHITYKKQTFIAIKTNFTHKLLDMFMYKKYPKIKSFFFAAILDAILYQGSCINQSQI